MIMSSLQLGKINNKKMFTLQQIQDALFPLINKDANTGDEKNANDFLLDMYNEAKKLIKNYDSNRRNPWSYSRTIGRMFLES